MNFSYIIIFAILLFNLKVLSSPIDSNALVNTLLSNKNEDSSLELTAADDTDIEVEVSSKELVNDADSDSDSDSDSNSDSDSDSDTENELNPEVETDSETETEITSEILSYDECLTPECYEVSKRILSKMDITVDPCEDFYQFSCGTWMKENDIPKNKYGIGIADEIGSHNEEILSQILEDGYTVDESLSNEDQKLDKEIFNKLKTIYDTCMDEDAMKKQGKEPIINLLNKFDLYHNKSKYEGADGSAILNADLHNHFVVTYFTYDIINDFIDNNINDFIIGQPDLLLLKDQYKDEKIISQYKTVIVETLNKIFEDQKEDRNIEEMANKIIEFEKKLSEILIPGDVLQNVISLYNPTTIGELMKSYPYINWKLYLSTLYKNSDVKTVVDDNTVIINATPNYFDGLNKILNEIDIDTLIYFVEWSIISKYIVYISEDINKPYNNFVNLLSGVEEKEDRKKTCITTIESVMGNALGKFFVQKAFNGNSKEIAKELIVNIKQAMIDRIPKISWLDKSTADYALEKADKITYEKIGYPDYMLKPKELLEKDCKGFEVDPDILLNTIVNYDIFNRKKTNKKIDDPVDNSEWMMTPQTVNAYYNPFDNSINFPAGILQSPFFDAQQPDYLNYGAIGSIIGHELTHAFDSSGSSFDANGVLYNWWTNSTYNEFINLTTCFVDQYNQYKIEVSGGKEINMNGKITLTENMSDNGGLKRSFEAWKLSSKDAKTFNERNKALPGLSDFTAEQLFYISFGQTNCEKITSEVTEKLNDKDPHSRGKYRVIGSVSNNEHFAKTFNCPKNSPMNPEKKCLIW